jgi:hypothetical protein
VRRRLLDNRGNFMLYRQIQPVEVEHLSFAGYNSGFFSPLSAEMAAVWIAATLAGRLSLPPPAAMRSDVEQQLAFLDDALDGHHCAGTKIIPFSLHNIDEILDDLNLNLGKPPPGPAVARAGQPPLVPARGDQSPAPDRGVSRA